jgi:hypothetical protein
MQPRALFHLVQREQSCSGVAHQDGGVGRCRRQHPGESPGGIRTADFDAYMEKIGPEKMSAFFQIVPLGRLGEPKEYAALAVYLASDENYCVGQIISPNGGLVM